MFGRLMPREGRFFDLFNRHADEIISGSEALAELMRQYNDVASRRLHIDRIDAVEKSADRITHETVALLHKTFVTPFDRDDIHKLISNMDDILDLIQDVAESAMLFDLQRITPEAQQLAELNEMCCKRVQMAVRMLPTMDNAEAILKLCREIGYDGVEFALMPGYPAEPRGLNAEARRALRQRLAFVLRAHAGRDSQKRIAFAFG